MNQLRVLYGPPRTYEVDYAFQIGPPGNQIPFGVVRVAVQTGLLRITYYARVAFGGAAWRWSRWEFPFCLPRS